MYFSPEDGNIVFLQNIFMYKFVNTVPKPRRKQHLFCWVDFVKIGSSVHHAANVGHI
jgi:hypothetical protein